MSEVPLYLQRADGCVLAPQQRDEPLAYPHLRLSARSPLLCLLAFRRRQHTLPILSVVQKVLSHTQCL